MPYSRCLLSSVKLSKSCLVSYHSCQWHQRSRPFVSPYSADSVRPGSSGTTCASEDMDFCCSDKRVNDRQKPTLPNPVLQLHMLQDILQEDKNLTGGSKGFILRSDAAAARLAASQSGGPVDIHLDRSETPTGFEIRILTQEAVGAVRSGVAGSSGPDAQNPEAPRVSYRRCRLCAVTPTVSQSLRNFGIGERLVLVRL